MYDTIRIRVSGFVPLALILALQFSCNSAQSGNMPITTSSEMALAAYNDGLHLADHFRANDARAKLQEAIDLDPMFAMGTLRRAQSAQTTEKFFELLDKAASISSYASMAEQQYITAANKQARGDVEGALKIFLSLSESFPDDARLSNQVGVIYYFALSDEENGVKWLERAVASQPDFVPPYNTLGYLYLTMPDFEKAETYFSKQIDLLPNEPNPHDSMGDMLSRAGRYDEAVKSYAKAVALDDGFVVSQRNIGVNLAWDGKFDEGRTEIMKAMDMAPNFGGKLAAQGAIARTYLYQSDLDAALAAVNKAIMMATDANRPVNVANYELMRARICIRVADHVQAATAIENCGHAIESGELDASVVDNWWRQMLYEEADLAARRQDFTLADEKTAALRNLIDAEKNPGFMQPYYSAMGKVDIQRGDYASAIDHLLQSNLNGPYDTYYLSRAYDGAGNATRAAELLERAAAWNADGQFYSLIRAEAKSALMGM